MPDVVVPQRGVIVSVPEPGVVMMPLAVNLHTFPGRTSSVGIAICDTFGKSANSDVAKLTALLLMQSGSIGRSSKYCLEMSASHFFEFFHLHIVKNVCIPFGNRSSISPIRTIEIDGIKLRSCCRWNDPEHRRCYAIGNKCAAASW